MDFDKLLNFLINLDFFRQKEYLHELKKYKFNDEQLLEILQLIDEKNYQYFYSLFQSELNSTKFGTVFTAIIKLLENKSITSENISSYLLLLFDLKNEDNRIVKYFIDLLYKCFSYFIND